MIEAKEATKNAVKYLNQMIPKASNILLEEVEKVSHKGKSAWSITLSFQLPPGEMSTLSFAMGRREYKSFLIDGSTGSVISMKIRQL